VDSWVVENRGDIILYQYKSDYPSKICYLHPQEIIIQVTTQLIK
jgi:hypothetical protein